MTWNYRIILHDDGAEHWLGLHEAHYDGDLVTSWTADPVTFVADADEGPEGITRSLAQALTDAGRLPVLRLSELPQRAPSTADSPTSPAPGTKA